MPEDIEALLRRLLHPDDAKLLDLDPRPEHLAIIERVATARQKDILLLLQSVTVPGGCVEPNDDRGDVVWAAGLRRFDDDPVEGLRFSQGWYTHLDRLQRDDIEVSAVHLAVAAYAVALSEHRLGRRVRARRWWNLAAVQTDTDPRCGLGIVAVYRATRLLV